MRKLWVLLVLLLVPAMAHADICDDIDEVAEAWDTTSTAIYVLGEEGFTRREAKEAEELIYDLLDITTELGDLMVEIGNRTERRMGEQLLDYCDDVEDADNIDDLVDSMDDVVDQLDRIVDYCDAN